MSARWLDIFFRFSGLIFHLKQNLVNSNRWYIAVYYAFLLIFTELGLVVISFPLYIIVSPDKIQKGGVYNVPGKPSSMQEYIMRRRIGLTSGIGVLAMLFVKFALVGVASILLLGAQKLLAATQSWNLSIAGDYTYDSAKIEVAGGAAQLKPIYGQISNSVIATLEFDTVNSVDPSIVYVSGDVYAIAYGGSGSDGFVETVSVNSAGAISAVIDVLEFDTVNGLYPDIVHVSGDIYAIAYSGSGADGFVTTVSIDSAGNIGAATIDFLEFDTVNGLSPDIVHVSGDIYAIAYEGPGNDGFVATVSIDSAGNVGAAIIDFLEFDTVNGSEPHIINVGSGYYAISYSGFGTDGWVVTVSIDGVGNVSNAIIDSLEFDPLTGVSSDIINVSGTKYAIAYEGVDNDGWLSTLDIDATGNIGAAVIDTLEFDTVQALFTDIINVAPNTFAIAYEGESNDGYVKTIDIDASGNIGAAVIDTLEFNIVGGGTPNIVAVTNSIYGIVFTDPASLDGFISTIEIPTTYDTSSPSIQPTTSLNALSVSGWNAFTETATPNGGSINYQLSDDDGATWKYWSGSAWATSTLATHYNLASVINSNINTFSIATKKIMWKAFFVSNGAQQVILDNIDIGYTENNLPVVSNVVGAQRTNAAGLVNVTYNLQDAESDPSSLSAYEYSTDNSTWFTMTATTTDPAHDGISGLGTSPSGVSHTFVWNASADLGAIYDTTVYVRLRANDGVGSGEYSASASFIVDTASPVVSGVSAVQTAGTTNVVVTYDLNDNTSTNLFVVLDVSEDAGSTWNVVTSTTSGDIGAGQTIGASKTITWSAGVDFDDQQQSDIRVRVRARDYYFNQGSNAESANFALDTLNPATNVTANILSQPNAGDTTVLIGGSFTEFNPNTNDFFVAINGGAYGTSTAGTGNTNSPSNQATPVGATLDGNDYISAVKIVHVDDFGQSFVNENTSLTVSLKYVKPYTPLAPTLANPGTNQLDLTIHPHLSEVSDLEYAINEVSTGNFVQADGTLGAGAVWRTEASWGTVTVNGLNSPISQYIFQVKSRNISDTSYAASSESSYSNTAEITNTVPSIALGSIAQTTNGTKYVTINYTGTDAQSNMNTLVTYEYSLDNSAWIAMTEKSGVGSDGVNNLLFASGGTAHDFMWDSGADAPGVEDNMVYVRLRSHDGVSSSTLQTSSDFPIDNVLPVVSNVTATQNTGARTVAITYDLAEGNTSVVELDISDDGGATWSVADTSVSGDVGGGIVAGAGKTITWNAGTDFDNRYETDMQVRVRASDTFGNQSLNSSSANFTVDTNDPTVANVTASQNSAADTFTFTYDLTDDIGSATVGLEISSDGGSSWTVPITSATGSVGVGVIAGTGKTISWNGATDYNNNEKTSMKIRITATDSYANSRSASSTNFSLDTYSPRVTSVLALQTAGSTNVVITYNLADQNTSTVELDISNDSGLTWNVATSTISGNIGAGQTAGTGKTITWAAGTDFDEQQQADMRVRVRARDAYEHQGASVESADFFLDTLNPAANITANVKAQPNAGDISVLIGGSFVETNPNTNNYYVGINGGEYGAAVAGDANTASPADHLVAAGATLDGNDYISKVKIIHVDDSGQSYTNENMSPNTAYKYVKPYTPAAPTVNNPGVGTVDVAVNKNALETDGLEYAIYETTQSKYVQTDGTLGASAVWKTITAWGITSVNGLANPASTYIFHVKSRNTSDTGHAATSESSLSSGSSSGNGAPSINIGTVAQTTDGTKYVTINYTGTDLESATSSIVTAEYSLNNITWSAMTEKSGVGSDGTTGLPFNVSGTAHDFMWDVGADSPNTEDGTVYVRLQANDGTSSGNTDISSAFTVDTKNPIVSAVSGVQVTNSNNVTFTYTLADLSNSNVELNISDDGGATWLVTDTSVTGSIGAGQSEDTGKTITWNAGADFDGQEQSDMRVQIRASDTFGNQGSYTESANFILDTKNPVVSNVSAVQNSGFSTVSITYDLSDAHNSTVELDISEDSGATWLVTDTSVTGAVGAGVASGTSKTITWDAGADFDEQDQADMRVRVRATDTFANAGSNVESANFSLNTKAPVITNVTAVQTSGSTDVVFTYDLAGTDSANIALDISENEGSTWTVTDTSVTGDVGLGIAAGIGKSITWNAGTDFDEKQQLDMRVRLRGTNVHNNMSIDVQSANFALDTLNPTVNVVAHLQTQPAAGDATALISGSFTEVNPNTNDFYVAINGGAYVTSSAGTVNTASPADQATAVGATLDGNDYISKLKIIHTDDFGQSVTSENTSPNVSLKYVKPYTPVAPTVSSPQNTTVDVTVIPHPSEASGLEYAIYENTTGKYVQLNGTLGVSAVWRATTAWGTTAVTGLTSPVGRYNFQTKSRNSSDTLHAASSESDLSANGAIVNSAPSLSISSIAQEAGGLNYVTINYIGTDAQNDTSNLSVYEYSWDNATWSTMTEKSGVGSDGVSGLAFTSAGANFTFKWDTVADMPGVEDGTVYIRLRASDGLATSSPTASSAFAVDNLGPAVSNVSASQTPGSNNIVFQYDLADNSANNLTVALDISEDGGATWAVTDTSVTGDVGVSTTAGTVKSITWDAGTDFDGQEQSDMRVRIRGTDPYGNVGSFTTSSNFTVDTKNPVVSNVSAIQTTSTKNVVITYDLSDITIAGHNVVLDISNDSGATWLVTDTNVSGDVGTGATAGTGKTITWNAGADFDGQEQSDMRVRVRSTDYFANQGAFASSANFAVDTKSPVVTNISAVQNSGSPNVIIGYDLSDLSSAGNNIEIDISEDNGATWNVVDTSVTGDVGSSVSAGNGKSITWVAETDFFGQYQTDMKVRLRGTDRFGNVSSYYALVGNFALDTAIPIVSNVTAAQTFGTANVIITYDLSDDNTSNLIVEANVSSDGGATWTVTTTNMTGNIGSGQTVGTGKSITWNTGLDFPGQDQTDMRVRVRAQDKFTNTSVFASSANFSLDNSAPTVNVTADLRSQPNAGDTTAVVGGSFNESNPSTNTFYLAINGGAYGAATAGSSNTSTPADQAVATGATLDGNDYISKVRIIHTDDFGLTSTNENTSPAVAYKYVKPYTPLPPLVENPTAADTVDITVVKNPLETVGLEYAIYEATTGKYIRWADGTYGADEPEWATISNWGTVVVTGLGTPASQFIFKTKSRNSSDAAHATSSESGLSSGASALNSAPSVVITSASQTTDGTKYVRINYLGVDAQNDTAHLTQYQYSTDNITWATMTEKVGVGSSGVGNLDYTSGGTSYNFAWDVATDLSNTEDSSVYARFVANDGVGDGSTVVSAAITVDTKTPVVSTVSGSQAANSSNVNITYDLTDLSSSTVVMDISENSGATWLVNSSTVSGSIGFGVMPGSGRTITWSAGTDFSGQSQPDMRVRIRATDAFGNQATYVQSSDFALDTLAPVITNVTASQSAGSSNVVISYDLSEASNSTVLLQISSDSGTTWTVATTTLSGNVGSGVAAGAGKSITWSAGTDFSGQSQSDMRVRLRATDAFANVGPFVSSSDFTLDTLPPTVSNVSASQTAGTDNVVITYDLSGGGVSATLDISEDGGLTWTVPDTAVSGDVGSGLTDGTGKSITWNAGTNFLGQDQSDMRVRVRASDSFTNASGYAQSGNFSLDTAAPAGLSSFSKFSGSSSEVTLHWSSGITDSNFNHYEIWHGASLADVNNRTSTAVKWDNADDAALANINTSQTVITGLNITTNYYMKIWAIDDAGRESTLTAIDASLTPVVVAPTVSGVSGGVSIAMIVASDITSPGKPILNQPVSPTANRTLLIDGLSEPRSVVTLYDEGEVVAILRSLADNNGLFSQTFTFAEGVHVFTVGARDAAGNVSPLSNPVVVTIDLTAPVAPTIAFPVNGSRVGSLTPLIFGSTEPGAILRLSINGQVFITRADANGSWSFVTPSGVVEVGDRVNIVARAEDGAGNIGDSSQVTVTITRPTLEQLIETPGFPGVTVIPPLLTPPPVPPAVLMRANIEATEIASLPVPRIASTTADISGENFVFSGTALPNQEVLVYLHSSQALIYQTRADSKGVWTVEHSQQSTELEAGNHTIFAVAVDPLNKVKSRPSVVQTFEVTKNFWVNLFQLLNLPTTLFAIMALGFTMLWLYRLRTKESVEV